MNESSAFSAAVAFLVALALVPALVRFAIGRNLLDMPNPRSSHEIPTPRLGGLAVIAGVWASAPFLEGDLMILMVATFAGFLGILDDVFDMPFWMKAVGQAVMAFALLLLVPPPILVAAGPLWPLALIFGGVWLVSMVNAYNFMDGIDGIAGGTAILNALFLAALINIGGGTGAGLVPLAASVTGFMMWNVSPARIFLGDSGSHFIGFFLGAMALYTKPIEEPGLNAFVVFVMAAAVFTPFLFDTAYTLVRRAWARKNVFTAHREHIYQRITPNPAKHRQVTNVYLGLSALSGLAALLAAGGTPLRFLGSGAVILGCCLFMALLPKIVRK